MKTNTSKKSSNPGAAPVPSMQTADALAYFDFSSGYPQWTVPQTTITEPYLQEIGLTLIDGVGQGVFGNDVDLLKKCCMALRERLCFNVEDMRVPFQMGGPKVISMMSPFQLAVLFGRLPICEFLFNFALTLPGSALRTGIDAPVSMINQLMCKVPTARAPERDQITLMATDFADRFAASLAQTNAEQLDPTSGMLFNPEMVKKLQLAGPMITASLLKQSALLAQQALQQTTPQAIQGLGLDENHRL
jgi:hypothetical protein